MWFSSYDALCVFVSARKYDSITVEIIVDIRITSSPDIEILMK